MPYELKREDILGLARRLNAETHEKGEELFFKYCPFCGGDGHDRNTFSINLKTGMFKCFRASCGRQGHFVQMAREFSYPLDFQASGKSKTVYRALPQKEIAGARSGRLFIWNPEGSAGKPQNGIRSLLERICRMFWLSLFTIKTECSGS